MEDVVFSSLPWRSSKNIVFIPILVVIFYFIFVDFGSSLCPTHGEHLVILNFGIDILKSIYTYVVYYYFYFVYICDASLIYI